jgi:PTS system N-acetylglucosamine-specific IIC component
LRLVVRDQALVDDAALKALGARGMIRPSATALQVVLGPVADIVAVEIRDAMDAGVAEPVAAVVVPAAVEEAPASTLTLAPALATALGGTDNIADSTQHHGRLRVTVRDGARVDAAALDALGVHGVARPAPGVLHLLGDEAVLNRLVSA